MTIASRGSIAGGLVLVGLVCLLALEWRYGPLAVATGAGGALSAPETTERLPNQSGNDATAASAAQVQLLLARPLFSPGRRPVESVGGDVAGLTRLTGVIITSSGSQAIFAGPAGGHPLAIEAGGHLGRYVIAGITHDGVTVEGPDGKHVLHPSFDTAPPVAPKTTAIAKAPPPRLPAAAK